MPLITQSRTMTNLHIVTKIKRTQQMFMGFSKYFPITIYGIISRSQGFFHLNL